MVEIIRVDDLPRPVVDAFEPGELDRIVAGLNAKALRVAPCLLDDPTPEQLAEAGLILLGTIKRWAEAGAGALTQKSRTAGPFTDSESYDTRQRTGYNLWPSEITDLQNICIAGSDSGGAFMVDMTPDVPTAGLSSRPDLWFQWVHPTPPGAS